ncbi:MAG: hypothetical protein ACM3MK_12225 [Chitinophagales bacterium]
MDDGWSMLADGKAEEALKWFTNEIEKEPDQFHHEWGKGKTLLYIGNKALAISSLERAVEKGIQAWEQQKIPFDAVEVIEKDLDRAMGFPEDRITRRIMKYLYGFLNLFGAELLEKALEVIEGTSRLRARVYRDKIIPIAASDDRFVVNDHLISLAKVKNPDRIVKVRYSLQVERQLELDDIAYWTDTSIIKSWSSGINSIIEDATGGNIGAEYIIETLMNAETFREAIETLERSTAVFNLKRFQGMWERFLFSVWVTLPRWELGGINLDESGIEDLWLGDINKKWIASILDLELDAEGNFRCPRCGEIVELTAIHSH